MASTLFDLLAIDNIYRIRVDLCVNDTTAGAVTIDFDGVSDEHAVTAVRGTELHTVDIVAAVERTATSTATNKLTIHNGGEVPVKVQQINLSQAKRLVPDQTHIDWYNSEKAAFDAVDPTFATGLEAALAGSDLASYVSGAYKSFYTAHPDFFHDDAEFASSHWTSVTVDGTEVANEDTVNVGLIVEPGQTVVYDLAQFFATATEPAGPKYPWDPAYIASKTK